MVLSNAGLGQILRQVWVDFLDAIESNERSSRADNNTLKYPQRRHLKLEPNLKTASFCERIVEDRV